VLFGGWTSTAPSNETWRFDGTDWRQAEPTNRPPARNAPALAYDVLRQRVVMFGGHLINPVRFGDTWEYDGTDWTQVFPAHAPNARWTEMCFDLARGRVVLFGGDDATAARDDTWVYDGTDWTQVAVPVAPWARSNHALAYDTARARTVMFGGQGPGATNDTWEFDGAVWTQVATPTSPPGRFRHGMAYDFARQRVVMFGGLAGFNPNLRDTWEYDGADWALRTPTQMPTPQWDTALAYDLVRQQTVLFGNGNLPGGAHLADTWTWDGADWTDHGKPASRQLAAFADDTLRGRTVMHGGNNSVVLRDTWEHDGTRWHRIATATSPALAGHALAFDPQRGRTVLFGGGVLFVTSDMTWEWDGANWIQRSPATSPPARMNHAMATDLARRRIVLFGGQTGVTTTLTNLNDTWEYDGTTWQQVTPVSLSPVPRMGTAMVFESARSRILLFGGTNNASTAGFSDTWVYDGTAWVQLAPAVAPPARHQHGLAYDVLRGRTLLFGGRTGTNSVLADTWEFDGANWTPVAVPAAPPGRGCSLVFQQHMGHVLGFGGSDQNRIELGETVTFVPPAAATFTQHGRGCPGSAGVPALDTVPPAVPALGTGFPLRLSSLPAGPGIALLAFGFDVVRWNGAPLPLGLGAFGLPGCDLWIDAGQGLSVLVPYAGTANYALALPPAPQLAGLIAGVQALVFDAGAPSGLGAVSNAGILRVY
jgi:hypothetical protein